MRTEPHNPDGLGDRPHTVYDMPPRGHDYWAAVTDVPCPVHGCGQTVVHYEAGYVPGYRVCMAPAPGAPGMFQVDTLRHRFLAKGRLGAATLVLLEEGS
jgi:hypothetical protein